MKTALTAARDCSPAAKVIRKENKPTYSHDQIHALQKVGEFLEGNPGNFSLVGPAGSGKTFITGEIVKLITESDRQLYFSTPTHKACAVLRQASGMEVRTIHSLLGAKLKFDPKTGEQYLWTKAGESFRGFKGAVVLIDEGSMVGQQLLALCEKLVTAGAYVIFIGDHKQVNPVGEEPSSCVDPDTCPWELVELTTIHRQALENPIIAAATEVRTTGLLTAFGTSGEMGVIALEPDQWRKQLLESCAMITECNRAVTYTNEASDRINRGVRRHVYGDAANKPYLPGEQLICNSRVKLSKDEIIENNTEMTVVKCTQKGATCTVTCRDPDGVEHKVKAYPSYQERDAFLEGHARTARQTSNWRQFYRLAETIADLRHSYAMTVHKSQGSTFDDVFISLNELKRCTHEDEHRRLLYVAVTRASRRVYVMGVES